MKIVSIFLALLIMFTACDLRSRNRKAADEIAARLGSVDSNLNVGNANYSLYVPKGWTTDHPTAYGINFFYLNAPKSGDDPNTNINVITEYMQNLPLDDYTTI